MHTAKARRSGRKGVAVLAGALACFAMIGISSASAGVGSDNTMFKRHFWRGQAYHGEGYHPQVSDIGRDKKVRGGTFRGPSSFEALIGE